MSTLSLYRGLTEIGTPIIEFLLARRQARGKEDPNRIPERRGLAGRDRPDGVLVWLHAASVGEAQSALALIDRILRARPQLQILVTTGTLTSARLMAERLPGRSFHQFVPIDRLAWIRRFLDHWRPDLVLWMESELWPNALSELRRREIPAIMVNARMSARSFRRWRSFSGAAAHLLSTFNLCLAQTELQAERLRALGAAQVRFRGNLKFSAAPLPAGGIELESLRRDVDGRPLWLAASTHPGEDAMVFEAHRLMRRTMPNLLTVLVPRHPSRGNEITEEMAATELKVARRSLGETVEPDTEFYLGDTLGELGLFYRLTGIAFIGGSMAAHGGHNPLEAAQLDCAILHGPDMANFETIAAELSRRGGAIEVGDAATLADAVAAFLKAPERRMAAAKTAADVAHENADAVEKVFAEIEPFLVGGI